MDYELEKKKRKSYGLPGDENHPLFKLIVLKQDGNTREMVYVVVPCGRQLYPRERERGREREREGG